jgi:hypothetical protein
MDIPIYKEFQDHHMTNAYNSTADNVNLKKKIIDLKKNSKLSSFRAVIQV